jgi:translation elongation factor EF-Tu-like GTPase
MNEPTLIARIDDGFTIENRGAVGTAQSLSKVVRVGDEVELRLPDGSRRHVRITAVEMIWSNPTRPPNYGLMFTEIADKSEIPDGTEIWSLK